MYVHASWLPMENVYFLCNLLIGSMYVILEHATLLIVHNLSVCSSIYLCTYALTLLVLLYMYIYISVPFHHSILLSRPKLWRRLWPTRNHYKEKQVKGLNFIKWSIFLCSIFICVCIAAVQRKYESLRRSWKLGEDESCKEREVKRGQEKKYRARKKRV